MQVESFLARLDGVRKSGDGWMCRCPAHQDRSPSLRVSLGDDGKILVKCFAGCTVADVCDSIGVSISDLFADDFKPGPKRKKYLPWADLFDAIEKDLIVLSLAIHDIVDGDVNPADARYVASKAMELANIIEQVRNGRL